ncbi:MAG: phage major capsid protein, partial [Acidimicrobiales bacterium]
DAVAEVADATAALRSFPPARVRVKSEPQVYRSGGPESWFRDLLAVRARQPIPGTDHGAALDRLRRGSEQAMADRRVRADVGRRVLEAEGVQSRDLSATTAGSGSEFEPPTWILGEFASVARAAAPLRKLARAIPLPDGTMTLRIPRFDVASGVVAMATENVAMTAALTATTDETTTPIRTIAGDVDVSVQLLDRGPKFDTLVTQDFAASYAAALEDQLVNGTGTSGQLLGLRNVATTTVHHVPGRQAVIYTSATPTIAGVVNAVAKAAAAVSRTRKRPPAFALMTPERYFWLAGTADKQTEPVIRPGTGLVAQSDTGPVGPVAGLPVYLDATIPTDLGATTNEDTIIVARGNDLLLLEGSPIFAVLDDVAGLAENLAVTLAYHVYVAAIPDRYPSSIGTVGGTGLVTAAGF